MGDETGRDEARDDRPNSLDEFSERLERVKGQAAGPAPKQGSAGAWGRAMRVSSDLLAGLFVGCLLGLGLDHWLNTKPVFLLVGMALGFAAGLRNMMRTLKSEAEQSSER